MQKTSYSLGPKFFGTTKKKSWFDEGDRCSPGPGAHSPAIPYATNPPQWGTSRDRERDSFLEKYHRQYPPPDRYKVTELNKTHTASPSYSVPLYEPKENPNKVDEGSSVDYRPRYHFNREKQPDHSFGYVFERDYSSQVPPPNAYNPNKTGKKNFNKTQRSFSVGQRPTPYGEEAKYPYVGKYNLGAELGGTKYSIGRTNRPDYRVGSGNDEIYNISGNLVNSNIGKTIGPPKASSIKDPLGKEQEEAARSKDQEDFPSPNHYNPNLPTTTRNIITFRSKRQELKNQGVEDNPSPQKYSPQLNRKEQTVSFTKQTREELDPPSYPGVGTYRVESQLSSTLGHMAKKLQKLTGFENPAPSAYDPKDSLTKPQPQRPINFESQRTDFSKSITGKNVGPGVYQVQKQDPILLGKIGKGPKFDPEKNKNPGPGSYDIGGGIGRLPKYCTGPKKLTETGFSCIENERKERLRRERCKRQAQDLLQRRQQEERDLQQQKSLEVK